MKKFVTIGILVFIAVTFVGALYYLYQKNQEDPVVYETEQPTEQTIVKNTVATGKIVPKEEVLIKPNISGIIDEIYIEAGDRIEGRRSYRQNKGDPKCLIFAKRERCGCHCKDQS